MKIRLKDESVNLDGLGLPMVIAIWWAAREYQAAGMETLTITSARDGKHSPGSLHECGLAVDLRIWGLPDPKALADRLRRQLDKEFDVVLEPTHLHIEFDPKK
jgi:hypothetical protein